MIEVPLWIAYAAACSPFAFFILGIVMMTIFGRK